MAYANGQPIPNQYAGAPPTPRVFVVDVERKQEMHDEAAELIKRANALRDKALKLLNEATALLDAADKVHDGDSGLDSRYARAQVANAADALELVDLDIAGEVRTCRR